MPPKNHNRPPVQKVAVVEPGENKALPRNAQMVVQQKIAEQTALANQQIAHQGAFQPTQINQPYPETPPELMNLVAPVKNPLPPGSNIPVVPVPLNQPIPVAPQPQQPVPYQPVPQPYQAQQPIQPYQQAPQQAPQQQYQAPPGYPSPQQYQNQPAGPATQFQYPGQPPQNGNPIPGVQPSYTGPAQPTTAQYNPNPQQIQVPNQPHPPHMDYPGAAQYGMPQQAIYPTAPPPPPSPYPQYQNGVTLQPAPGIPAPPPPSSMAEFLAQQQRLPQAYPDVADVMAGKVPNQAPLNHYNTPNHIQRQPQQPPPPPVQVVVQHEYTGLSDAYVLREKLNAYVYEDCLSFERGQIVSDPGVIAELFKGGAQQYLIPLNEIGKWVECPQCHVQFPQEQGQLDYARIQNQQSGHGQYIETSQL